MDKGFVRDRGKAFYYGSLEFKGMSEAIRGSRSCGVLLSGDTVLVVYNTMDRNMKWAKKDGMFHAYLDRANALKGRI